MRAAAVNATKGMWSAAETAVRFSCGYTAPAGDLLQMLHPPAQGAVLTLTNKGLK